MFVVQFLDYEEGSCARWHDIVRAEFNTRDEARAYIRHCRENDDEYCLYSYRVAEKGSALYYSQPTDRLEY